MRRRLFFYFLLFLLPTTLVGQRYLYKYYSEKDGLCGNHVYHVMQDKQGYLWFATSTGVSLYDGITFQNFTTNDGLTDYEVLSMFEDRQGRIWFKTFNGKPCFYHNGTFFNGSNFPLLRQVKLNDLATNVYQDSNDAIWIGSSDVCYKIDLVKAIVTPFHVHGYFFAENKEREMMMYLENDQFYNSSLDKIVKMTIDFEPKKTGGITSSIILKNNNIIYAKQNELYYFDQQQRHIQKINTLFNLSDKEYITAFHEGRDDQLYLATNNGVFILNGTRPNELIQEAEHLLEGNNATSIFLDHQGSIWITTSNGVYQLLKERFQKIDHLDGSIIDFAYNRDQILIAAANKEIQLLDRKSHNIQTSIELFLKPTKTISDRDVFYVLTNNGAYKIEGEKPIKEIFSFNSIKDMVIRDDYFYLAIPAGVIKVAKHFEDIPDFRFSLIKNEKLAKEIIAARPYYLKDLGNSISASTSDGLFTIVQNEAIKIPLESDPHQNRILNINTFLTYDIIGTEGNGIYIYSGEKLIKHFNIESGLNSNYIKNTFIVDNQFYIVTRTGIHLLDKELQLKNLRPINKSGLVIYKAEMLDGNLMIATSEGLLIYELNEDLSPVPVHKAEIIATRETEVILNGAQLAYEDVPIDFTFKLFNFTNEKINYSYRLLGANNNWKDAESNSVSFQNIKPGKYEFQLKAGGSIIKSLPFELAFPFWAKWWFYLLCGVFSILMIFLIYKWQLNRKLKEQAKSHVFNLRIAKAEQDALKAQMNPHFIFNSLNAIQNLILQNSTDKAYSYLGDFSKLVRRILNNSRNLNTTVEKEIAFLNLYLKLESMRFDSKFEYSITMEKAFDCHQSIPSMVIQPFAENAVIHGLLPLANSSHAQLDIKFSEDENFIYCKIDDNGVGRKHSKQITNSKASLGLNITKERLLLYDESGSSNFDILDKKAGTQIILKIKKHE